jgi:nicotinamidase-related amidase
MPPLELDPRTTALVLIDLQQGIVARTTAPHISAEVVERSARIAERFRQAGSLVVLVRVGWSADEGDRLRPQVDEPVPAGPAPDGYSDLLPEVGPRQGDIVVTKRQWGAFYGTELDLQLRRRGVHTIVIGGIATNFGVESTARQAWERGYQLVFVEDAMAAISAAAHAFAIGTIFPRIGLVRSSTEVLTALAAAAGSS